MTVKRYKLSEEVCLQCLRVTLERNGWIEWFQNPTAGPWKRIKIEGVEDDDLFRFRKEEVRPDLIISHESKRLIIVLEAKDDIEQLINVDGQVQKSVKTFRSMFKRLQTIFERYKEKVFGASPPDETELLCGYLVPAKSDLGRMNKDLAQLSELHEIECQRIDESQGLLPHVIFIITFDSSQNLYVRYSLKSCPTHLSAKIRELFPATVKVITSPLNLRDY